MDGADRLKVYVKRRSGLTTGDDSTTLHLEGPSAYDASLMVWEIVHRGDKNHIDAQCQPYERYADNTHRAWEWWAVSEGGARPLAPSVRVGRVIEVANEVATKWGTMVTVY